MDGYYGRFPQPKRLRQPIIRNRLLRPRWPATHAIRNPQFQQRPRLRHPHPSQHIGHQTSHDNKLNLKITVPDLPRSNKNPSNVFKRLGKPVDDTLTESLHEKNEMKSAYLLHKEKLKTKREQNLSIEKAADKVQKLAEAAHEANKTVTSSKEKCQEIPKSVSETIKPKTGSGEALNDLSLLAHYLLHRRTLKSKQDNNATSDAGSEDTAPETKADDQQDASVIDMDISEVNTTKEEVPAPEQAQEIPTKLQKPIEEKIENPPAARHVEKDTSEESRHLLITTHFEKKSEAETLKTEIPPENRSTKPNMSWYCVVCDMEVKSEKITHYREEIHKKNKKLARPHCDVCDQWFNRPRQLVQHVKSKEHKDKAKEARGIDNIGIKTEQPTEGCTNDVVTADGKQIQPDQAPFVNAVKTLESPFSLFSAPPLLPDLEIFSPEAGDSALTSNDKKEHLSEGSKTPTKTNQHRKDTTSAKDMPHIIPVAGFYCEVCCDFFFDEASTLSHCKTQSHLQEIGKANGDVGNKSGSDSTNSSSGTKTKRRRKSATPVRPLASDKKPKLSPQVGAAKLVPKSDLGVPRKTITTEQPAHKTPPKQLRNPKQSPSKQQHSINKSVGGVDDIIKLNQDRVRHKQTPFRGKNFAPVCLQRRF